MTKEDLTPPDDSGSPTAPPFELIVGDIGGEILNGDVPVRWCVTPSLVEKLEEDGIVDPHVLLVSCTENMVEMQRQMVPITELMTYVRFTRAGNMRLYGFIIDGAAGRKKLNSTYVRKIGGDYSTEIFFTYTNDVHDNLPSEYCRTMVKVSIPEGVFGAEPSAWMKWYVNYWHTSSGKVVDECHYRRRMMLAFSLKWMPFLIWTMMMITGHLFVSGALVLAGFYKNNKIWRSFRPHKWPSLDYNIIDEVDIDIFKNPFFFSRKYIFNKGTESERTTHFTLFTTLPLNPLLLLLQAGMVGAFAEYFGETMISITAFLLVMCAIVDMGWLILNWLQDTEIFSNAADATVRGLDKFVNWMEENNHILHFKIGVMGVVVAGAFYIIFAFMSWAAAFLVPIIVSMIAVIIWGEQLMTWLDNLYTIKPENNNYGEIKELLCPKDEANLMPNYDFIPPKQRTVRLWYLDLKHKVCKPMQQ